MAQRVTLEELALETVAALGGEPLVRAAGVAADEVWAVGKAACAMARGAAARTGLVITKQAEPMPGELVVYEAGHPIPDERGVVATRALLERARSCAGHVLLCLSGGGSALLAAPVDGVSLAQLRAATRALLDGGAPIGEINTVRRHLGAALGGKLAAATRARLTVLALSDVVGDDPAAIASGPASPDPTTLDDARQIARRYGLPDDLLAGAPETPKTLPLIDYRILATPLSLRDEAARRARGWTVRLRDQLVRGPVEEIAAEIASLPLLPGELWIAAGEPTVRVHGGGMGGRAQHLALLVARALAGRDVSFVALGSDGSDGPTTAAGALVDGATWENARARSLDPSGALARFDSHPLLAALGATLVTGATGTNLTDLLLLGRRA
jgi:glycerate 2-kinase